VGFGARRCNRLLPWVRIFEPYGIENMTYCTTNCGLLTQKSSISPHYSREMRGQSQAFDIVHNYANGLFDEVFCNEISGPGVWWPGSISGGPMNYSG